MLHQRYARRYRWRTSSWCSSLGWILQHRGGLASRLGRWIGRSSLSLCVSSSQPWFFVFHLFRPSWGLPSSGWSWLEKVDDWHPSLTTSDRNSYKQRDVNATRCRTEMTKWRLHPYLCTRFGSKRVFFRALFKSNVLLYCSQSNVGFDPDRNEHSRFRALFIRTSVSIRFQKWRLFFCKQLSDARKHIFSKYFCKHRIGADRCELTNLSE